MSEIVPINPDDKVKIVVLSALTISYFVSDPCILIYAPVGKSAIVLVLSTKLKSLRVNLLTSSVGTLSIAYVPLANSVSVETDEVPSAASAVALSGAASAASVASL